MSTRDQAAAVVAAAAQREVKCSEPAKKKQQKKKPMRKEARRDFLEQKVSRLVAENKELEGTIKLPEKEDSILQDQLLMLEQAYARMRRANNKLSGAPVRMQMQCVPTIVSRSEIA